MEPLLPPNTGRLPVKHKAGAWRRKAKAKPEVKAKVEQAEEKENREKGEHKHLDKMSIQYILGEYDD